MVKSRLSFRTDYLLYPVQSRYTFLSMINYLFRSIVLDYDITINKLREQDRIFVGGSLGNYSLAGFEMILRRHVSHYIINYYLPSGLFVVVSWISFLVPADIIPGTIQYTITIRKNRPYTLFENHRKSLIQHEWTKLS